MICHGLCCRGAPVTSDSSSCRCYFCISCCFVSVYFSWVALVCNVGVVRGGSGGGGGGLVVESGRAPANLVAAQLCSGHVDCCADCEASNDWVIGGHWPGRCLQKSWPYKRIGWYFSLQLEAAPFIRGLQNLVKWIIDKNILLELSMG